MSVESENQSGNFLLKSCGDQHAHIVQFCIFEEMIRVKIISNFHLEIESLPYQDMYRNGKLFHLVRERKMEKYWNIQKSKKKKHFQQTWNYNNNIYVNVKILC